jgi:uncharacterized membrane protein YphA (DoxX/SURF4 family)
VPPAAFVHDDPAYDRVQRWPEPLRQPWGERPQGRRRIPLNTQRFQIGVLAVVALVALRLGLGCHFLYEGVWKIKHRDEFTAEPFLTLAKGPISPLFYAMVPDIDGRQRLRVETDAGGKKSIDSSAIVARWDGIRQRFVDYYRPAKSADAAAQGAYEQLERAAARTGDEFRQKLDEYFKANVDDIAAHFGALDRFEQDKERYQQAPFQKQRRWDRMMELRGEANVWIKDIEAQELALENSLYSLLDDQQRERGRVPGSWNPFRWNQMEQINFAVTYGLTAIGICLMLGFCTPLAALGGAAFMCFVVMTQPAFPGIYPPDPAVVGHALLVNKDFVEMLALLTVAAASAGRWGGLDFFLYRWIVNPLLARKAKN